MSTLNERSALGILFANTKRKKRTADLITVAEACQYLINLYGSQKAVAQKVGLSTEMIREFRKLLSLPKEVSDMIRRRQIDSLDIAYRISMLNDQKKQLEMANQVAELQTTDVRDVKRLIDNTDLSVKESKRRVIDSKLKGLHVFILDFSDEEYKAIIELARKKKEEPAELVKEVVLKWIRKKNYSRKNHK